MRKALTFLFCCFLTALYGHEVKMRVERLPDLNIPRAGHSSLLVDGELMVIGGHTSGFVPTATAEYLSGGRWHVLHTVYSHDDALTIPLRSGRILLVGGHEQPLGIGQTFSFEYFDPATRTFTGYGCLDKKRVFPGAIELADSTVIITGNWYTADGIEQFNGSRQNQFVADVTQERSSPHVFLSAPDDAIIFSAADCRGQLHDTIIVDRLKGSPYHPALFDRYLPQSSLPTHQFHDSFIGDEAAGDYRYLFTVMDRETGQIAVGQTHGTDIGLLPTTDTVPMHCRWGKICWGSPVIVDRKARRAYLCGYSPQSVVHTRFYVLAIDYSRTPAPLTFCYTDPQPADVAREMLPVLTADGNIALLGGTTDNNFTPYASALLLCVNGHDATLAGAATPAWLWPLVAACVLAALVFFLYRHYRRAAPADTAVTVGDEVPAALPVADETDNNTLMQRICDVMEQQQAYLNCELKVGDVSAQIGTNSRYVSDCIKSERGLSFTQFVNTYRIDYGKRLLCSQPDMKISAVAVQSGFANETSFFRTFKALTGMTPREWLARQEKAE